MRRAPPAPGDRSRRAVHQAQPDRVGRCVKTGAQDTSLKSPVLTLASTKRDPWWNQAECDLVQADSCLGLSVEIATSHAMATLTPATAWPLTAATVGPGYSRSCE